MRVVAGSLGGRTFEAPRGHRTHPMGDKVRGALFNTLGDIEGLTVLDAFAGSGAMSIEAISRGAVSCAAIEVDKGAVRTITENLKQLGIADQVKPIRANASSWSTNNPDMRFDLVILDPPYDALNDQMLVKLALHVRPGGLVVLSLPPRHTLALPDGFELLSTKVHGDASLLFYRRNREA